ncbi:eukaryotic translation initiation factor 3 subunit M [Citrus sinensis]|uniref:Eukaryotic translation initiation factor 3 subunit M n=1 Tax=Citrus sinensis TaxID=2711 RepID=A0ACB8K7L2_CITSI|nr:eukaryotic translation initiation factor 3 subunit M [Citrus sinensis]
MTTVVPTSEEDPALAVVRFTSELAWADAGPEAAEEQVNRLCLEAQESMVMGRWMDLASLMLTSADLMFSKVSDKDLECIFTVICNLVTKPESLDEVHEMTKLISGKIIQQPNDKPAMRLKISSKDSFKFLTKYLATFSGEDAHTMDEAKEEAVRTIIEFVKSPDMFQCDLLDMPAIGQLENDAKYASVYQLLKIFLTQRLDGYLEFQAGNSALLKSYGLVHEDCIAKMRLMSLVDLGSNESGQIPYGLIKDTLQINNDEVEKWVVKARTAKLMDCKMDQMNQVVIVRRCTERIFGQHQWQTLRTKLSTWRANVANVISTIQATNKITEDGSHSQAVQGLIIR